MEVKLLSEDLQHLQDTLNSAARASAEACRTSFETRFFPGFDVAVAKATKEAPTIATKWGRQKKDGGVPYQTYKAIVVRGGTYQSKSTGHHDFNEELAAPLKRGLAKPWDKMFTTHIPEVTEDFARVSKDALETFHESFSDRVHHKIPAATIGMLSNQLRSYVQSVKNTPRDSWNKIRNESRQTSRHFTPGVRSMMTEGYSNAADESGRGCFNRMKKTIYEHVVDTDEEMFLEATKRVRNSLLRSCKSYKNDLILMIDATIEKMKADYTNTVTKQEIGPEKNHRDEIRRILANVDDEFAASLKAAAADDGQLVPS